MSDDNKTLKVVKGEDKAPKRELTKYTQERDKTYNEGLVQMLGMLKGLPQKNPLAFEISRGIKKVEEALVKFEDEKSDIMTDFLLVDVNGNWVVNESVAKSLEEAAKKGKQLVPTVFAYVVDGNKIREFEYKEKMGKLINEEQIFNFKSVDAKAKLVKVGELKEPLINILSEYFESGQINFLEKIGILTGLDD